MKKFGFATFCLLLLKISRTFQKNAIFHLWVKAMPLLKPFGPKILWKIDVNKKTKSNILNDHISKTRTNSEWKLKFSESSFNLLQNSVYFCSLYPRGYTAGGSTLYNPHCCCQRFAGLKGKGLMMSQKKNWTCSLLSISFTNEQKLLINCNFSLLGKINVFTYPIKPWNTLKNCHWKKKQLP